MYTRSRAEGEAIVFVTDDLRTTSERQTPRMAHNERIYLCTGYNAARGATANADASPPKAENPRGETERSDRTPPRRSDSDGATQRQTLRMGGLICATKGGSSPVLGHRGGGAWHCRVEGGHGRAGRHWLYPL